MSEGEIVIRPEKTWDYTLISYGEDQKPMHETGWPNRILDIDGKKVEAHETNNLLMNILQAKKLREELRINPTAPMLGRARDFYFKQGAYAVFTSFEDYYEELHAELIDINRRLLEGETSIDVLNERDIQASVAFEKLAAIALAFDPAFKINLLTV